MAPATAWKLLQKHDNRQPPFPHTCAMKIKIILTAFALMAATGLAAAATNDVATLVQRGLFEEEANHQLDAAIRNYREAIEQFDHDRPLAATAIFRLGECYRKQGKTNEANAQFERIVREFPDQTQLAQLSQGFLPALAGGAPSSVIVGGGSATMPSEEADFLRKVIETAQTSPDLLNQEFRDAVEKGYVAAAQYLIAHGAEVGGWHIWKAAQAGNEAMVQLLLSHGADVNSHLNGDTPLHTAVQRGFMTICHTLVAHGADVNAKNNDGSTPLHAAAAHGNSLAAEFLITNNAQIDAKNNKGETPLLFAVLSGNSNMVKLLLANHAEANAGETHGETPLSIAIERVNTDIVKLLLEHGADANATNAAGETPLAIAISRLGDNDVVKLLLDHHADANMESSDGQSLTITPLGLAAIHDHPEMVKMLLADHADPNAAYSNGETPLLTAIRNNKTEILKLLLDNHANANLEAVSADWSYSSYRLAPLVWAIQYQRPEFVKLLLEHQADPNAVRSSASLSAQASFEKIHPSSSYHTPFGQPNIGWEGAPPGPWRVFPPVAGETPLMFAATEPPGTAMPQGNISPGGLPGVIVGGGGATQGHGVEMAPLLLDHGAKPNAVDPDGWTALIYAIGVENSNTVRTLIQHGADVNILDKEGRPPLAHLSTSDTGRQIKAMLVKAGADADYNRRRGIWTCGPGGTPKTELFQCPTNSINHYTLLEFLATLYKANPGQEYPAGPGSQAGYAHGNDLVPFPDFARIAIHRLNGKRAEGLHVNATDILQSGDGSKDVALQAGDMVEIPEQEHKVADKWVALSPADVTALNKCLFRTVHLVAQGKTNLIALAPLLGVVNNAPFTPWRGTLTPDFETNWLTEALHGRKPDTIVRSFLLNKVVRDANVWLSTWDLSRVQLTRHGAKMTFDLTANPPPDVWLENSDVIEIPEIGEGAAATEAK
jgi:ankyrin repeat protein